MQKKHIFIPLIALTLVFISYHLSSSPTLAASPLPSASPLTDSDVTASLKKKIIENLGSANEATPSAPATAYLGVVKDIIKDTLIIDDKDGKKDIMLSDATTILRSPGNSTIKVDSVRIDDSIIAIGYLNQNGELDGRRLIVSADPIVPPHKETGMGTISKLSKTSLTLTVDGQPKVLAFTAKTIYKSPAGMIDSTTLEVSDTLVYTATIDDHDVLTASVIMRIKTASL